jgi:glucokinase
MNQRSGEDLVAGVDLGGTTIAVALADRQGYVVAETEAPTNSHEGPDAVVYRIGQLVHDLASRAGVSLTAVGMGFPGLVDVARGVTRFLPNLPTQWRDVPVAETLRKVLGCPVYLLNDVRTATLGELTYGHGKTSSVPLTMAFFSIGTGIGGGVVVDGKLRLGPLGAAGELGHQTILPEGPRCGCGNRGCLETLASGPAIASEGIRLMRMGLAPKLFELVGGEPGRVTPREMLASGDASVREAIDRAAHFLGIAVANVVTMLHPELVVLGGGVAELGDALLDPVRQMVRQRVGMFPTDSIRIEKSQLGDRAGILGAVALAALAGRV